MSKTVFERVALARKALVLATAFCASGAALLVPCAVRAATDDTTTTSIQRGPEAERALKTR